MDLKLRQWFTQLAQGILFAGVSAIPFVDSAYSADSSAASCRMSFIRLKGFYGVDGLLIALWVITGSVRCGIWLSFRARIGGRVAFGLADLTVDAASAVGGYFGFGSEIVREAGV